MNQLFWIQYQIQFFTSSSSSFEDNPKKLTITIIQNDSVYDIFILWFIFASL